MVSFVPAQKGAKNMKYVLMADPEALSLVGGEAHHHQPSAVHLRTCELGIFAMMQTTNSSGQAEFCFRRSLS